MYTVRKPVDCGREDTLAVLVIQVVGVTRKPHGGVEEELGSVSPDKVALLHLVSATHPQV